MLLVFIRVFLPKVFYTYELCTYLLISTIVLNRVTFNYHKNKYNIIRRKKCIE